jgi:type I restriction enzyme S subunit
MLMAMYGANVGKLGRLGIDAATNQAICAFFPRSGILSGFLWQYLRLIRDELILSSFGAAQPNISQAFIRRLEVPVPPLTEQERIVTRIESLTTRAQELAEHTQAIASDMQRAVASFYERLGAEAPQKPLEAVASPVRRPITTTPEGSYPELGLRSFGKGTFHKPALSGTEVGGKRIFRIHAGDLVFSNVFGWEGAIAVAQPEDDGRAGSHRYITYLADPAQSTPEFLCFHFLTPRGLEDIRAASPGSAGRNRTLGLERLKQIQVPVPPIEEQRRFTELVKRQREITKHAASITEDLRRFEAALLAKAFRGEL